MSGEHPPACGGWQTGDEQEGAYFDVERCTCGNTVIDRELEQICWQSGYAAGVVAVVAWLKDHETEDWTLWDAAAELEHGALGEVTDA